MIHPGESHHSCFIFFNRWEVQNCWFNMRIFTSAELSSNGTFQKIFFKSLSVMIFLTFNIKLIFNITPVICINICCEHWVKIYWGLTLTFFSEIFVRRESFSSWLVNEPENILHLFPRAHRIKSPQPLPTCQGVHNLDSSSLCFLPPTTPCLSFC